jgi:tetratricopeptide (TPR) repeat protein
LRRAGELAAARYANAEAVDYFTRALELAPESDLATRFVVMVALDEAYDALGAREAQRTNLALLAELVEAADDDAFRCEVAIRLAGLEFRVGKSETCVAWSRSALAHAESLADTGLRARSLQMLGVSLWDLKALTESRRALEEALVAAREAGVSEVENACLGGLAVQAAEEGDLETSHAYDQQALELAYARGDLDAVIASLDEIGFKQLIEGDPISATATFEECLRLTHQIGRRRYEGYILMNLGSCAYALGDYAVAQVHQAAAQRIADALEDHRLDYDILVSRVELLHQMGVPQEMYREAERGLEMAEGFSHLHREANLWMALGLASGDLGREAESAAAYRRALEAVRSRPWVTNELLARAGLARADLMRADLVAALEQVEQILPHMASNLLDNSVPQGPYGVYLTCYRVLRATEDLRAAGVLEHAFRLIQERAARIPNPEQRRSFTENLIEVRAILAEHVRLTGGTADVRHITS